MGKNINGINANMNSLLILNCWLIIIEQSSDVMQDCVMGALGKKTVILVTHQVEFLAEVDTILVSSYLLRIMKNLDNDSIIL